MSEARIETETTAPTPVAKAISPDNTAAVETRAGDGTVVTTVERSGINSLAATVDDYIVALNVATAVVQIADDHHESAGSTDEPADTPTDTHE